MVMIRTRKKGRGKGKKYPIKGHDPHAIVYPSGLIDWALTNKRTYDEELINEHRYHFRKSLINKRQIVKEQRRQRELSRKEHERRRKLYPDGFHFIIVDENDELGNFF